MSGFRRWLPFVVLVNAFVLCVAGEASAQSDGVVAPERPASGIRASIAAIDFDGLVVSSQPTRSRVQTSRDVRKRSTTRKVVGGIIGGVGGFFGGGYLGAAIEGDRCHCDDPGLMGALIGAPVGAAIGTILGVTFF